MSRGSAASSTTTFRLVLLALGGSVIESSGKGYVDARAGTLALSGTKTENRAHSNAPSGSVALSGTAVDSWSIRTVYNDAPVGRLESLALVLSHIATTIAPLVVSLFLAQLVRARSSGSRSSAECRCWGWAARSIPASTPQPVGIPGALAEAANIVVNPTVLRPPIRLLAIRLATLSSASPQAGAARTSIWVRSRLVGRLLLMPRHRNWI